MCVVALRIVPAAPTLAASRAAASARTALRLERHVKAEPRQRGVLSVQERQAVLRWCNREPDAGPDPGTVLHPSPVLGRSDAVETLSPLAVHCEGKDALLFA